MNEAKKKEQRAGLIDNISSFLFSLNLYGVINDGEQKREIIVVVA